MHVLGIVLSTELGTSSNNSHPIIYAASVDKIGPLAQRPASPAPDKGLDMDP